MQFQWTQEAHLLLHLSGSEDYFLCLYACHDSSLSVGTFMSKGLIFIIKFLLFDCSDIFMYRFVMYTVHSDPDKSTKERCCASFPFKL